MHLPTLAEHEIIMTLVALALLLAGAYLLGTLFERLKAPRVVGEILGGVLKPVETKFFPYKKAKLVDELPCTDTLMNINSDRIPLPGAAD